MTSVLLVFLTYGAYRIIYSGKVIPYVWVGGEDVSGMEGGQLFAQLNEKTEKFIENNQKIVFEYQDLSWETDVEQLGVTYDIEASVEQLINLGRRGNMGQQIEEQWDILRKGRVVGIKNGFDNKNLADFVATMSAEINIPSVPTSVSVLPSPDPKTGSRILIEEGESGVMVEEALLSSQVSDKLKYLTPGGLKIPVTVTEDDVSEDELKILAGRAEKLLDKSLTIVFINEVDRTENSWSLEESDLIEFLDAKGGFDQTKIEGYLEGVVTTIDRPAQDALFQFDSTINRVVEFKPSKDGLKVNKQNALDDVVSALTRLESEDSVDPVGLVTNRVPPSVANGQVNRLGIKELLGRGESTFFGSIPSRIHNIKLAASRLNGLLVAPGETFSYNSALGEVSAATGFQQAYVISQGRTVLGDGGGVCQDSTTLFRTVLDAGLPIAEWRNHSYRVGYYEQNSKPGFDATVFAPTTDFKFINDTQAHILIQAWVEGSRLVIEFYGTNDGRVATISNYKMWDVAPPPPDLYQDDPTLPVGTTKQVDWKAWGGKTKFDYTVTKDGETIFEKTFYSNFRPWQSVFLRGTGGV